MAMTGDLEDLPELQQEMSKQRASRLTRSTGAMRIRSMMRVSRLSTVT